MPRSLVQFTKREERAPASPAMTRFRYQSAVRLTRAWNESVAPLAELVRGGVPTLVFLSLVAALLFALGWYFWPPGCPSTGGSASCRRDRGADRRHAAGGAGSGSARCAGGGGCAAASVAAAAEDDRLDLPPDELPDLPADVLALTADQLAAAGRYAEAVRERLRAMVR